MIHGTAEYAKHTKPTETVRWLFRRAKPAKSVTRRGFDSERESVTRSSFAARKVRSINRSVLHFGRCGGSQSRAVYFAA